MSIRLSRGVTIPPGITLNRSTLILSSMGTLTYTYGQSINSRPITTTDGYAPFIYSISPALPTGISFDTSSGYITGTFTNSLASTSYTITVRDPAGSKSLSFNLVVNPVSFSLSSSTQSYTYNQSVNTNPVTVSGGYGTLTYSISPALPSGLSFDTTNGYITGTASTTKSTTSYTVTVTDQTTPSAQVKTSSFNLTVAFPVLSATPTSQGLSQDVSVNVKPVAITGGYGTLTYSLSPSVPTGLSFNTSTGYLTGTATVTQSNTSYTVTVTDQTTPTPQSVSSSFNISVTSINISPNSTLANASDVVTWSVYNAQPNTTVYWWLDSSSTATDSSFTSQVSTGGTITTDNTGYGTFSRTIATGNVGLPSIIMNVGYNNSTVKAQSSIVYIQGSGSGVSTFQSSNYTGAYNDISGASRPSTTRSFTIESWVKWDTGERRVGTIIGSPSDRLRQPHFLAIYIHDNYWDGSQTQNASNIRVDGYYLSQNIFPSPVQFVANVWYHIAVSRDATNSNIEAVWVNGVRAGGTQTDTRIYSGNSLELANGWPLSQDGLPFKGKQADVRIVSDAYVYNPTSTTITVPTSPLSTVTKCIGLIQANSSAVAVDNSAVGQTITATGIVYSSDSPYVSGGTGSWRNITGNSYLLMDPGIYNC